MVTFSFLNNLIKKHKQKYSFCPFPDPHMMFVPEEPEDLVVVYDDDMIIPCRTTQLNHVVELIRIPTREKFYRFYDYKLGFAGEVSPGQYLCEVTVNGQTFQSAIYTVKSNGKSEQNYS